MGFGGIPFFSNVPLFWRMFSKYRWRVATLVTLGFFSAILEGIGINAVIPLLSFLVSSGKPTDFISTAIEALFHILHITFTFRYLLAFILGLFMVRSASMVVFGYIRGRITADYLSTESQEMLRLSFGASWPFLLKQKLGHVHSTLTRDVQRSANLLEAMGQVIQSFTGFLMYLIVAINISLWITFFTLVAGGALFAVVRPLIKKIQQTGWAMISTEKNISHFLSEHIIGMKAIKASGVEEKAFIHSQSMFEYMRRLYIKMVATRSLSTSLFQPFSIIFVIILFAITYRSGNLNLVAFAATLYLIQKIFTYLESGQNALNAVKELVPHAEYVQRFKQSLVEHTEISVEGTKPFSLEKGIEFTHVRFGYTPEKEDVLADVHFRIQKGDTVGLIGPSGAGKTSVADLLLRLFVPTGGEILVDGVPLQHIHLSEWRKNVGYVSQDVFLLHDTIEANIRFYRDTLSHEEILSAVEQANLRELIDSLPNGLDTIVGDRGVMLSGGQRQRVALARALVGRPALLILDEATSALDSESEKLIQQSIDALHGHITVLIIAHRLSTIDSADKVMVLSGGRIVEQGTPKELSQTPNSYFARSRGARA